jgi:hypothetical protein
MDNMNVGQLESAVRERVIGRAQNCQEANEMRGDGAGMRG